MSHHRVIGDAIDQLPRPLTGGAVMAATSRAVVAVSGAGTTILLARVLGPEGWGTYFVAQSVIAMLTVAGSLGVDHGIAYYVSSRRWDPGAAFRRTVVFATVLGLAGALLALVVRLLAPSAFAGLTLWLAVVVVVATPFALARVFVSSIALAVDRYEAYMLITGLQAVIALGLASAGAITLGLNGAVIALSVSTVVVSLGSVLWGRRRFPRAESGDSRDLRRAITFGIKGYAANALQFVNYRLDVFVLSAVSTTAVVGQYSLAVAVTSLLWLLPGALSDVLYPRVAHLSSRHERNRMREMVETKSMRHGSLFVWAGTLVLAAGLALFVVPIFGEGFRPTIVLGLILLPGVALIGIASILAATVVGRGRPECSLYVGLVNTPVTVLLYVTLIPWLDARGAALASTLSYLCNFVLFVWFYRRVTGRPVLPLLVPTRSEFDDLRELSRTIASRVDKRR